MNNFKIILSSFFCLFCVNTNAQSPQEQFLTGPHAYFGQKPPGNTPEEFGGTLLKVAGKGYQNSSFSPDGKEFLYSVFHEETNSYTIYQTSYKNNGWTAPRAVSFLGSLKDKIVFEPRHHPNGKVLYLAGEGELYFSVKKNDEWSTAKKLTDPINLPNTEHPSLDQNSTLYFWSRREGKDDLYKSEVENGKYHSIVNLGAPVNSPAFDGDPFIAIDGEYLIFTSNRGMATAITEGTWSGAGGTDLYISYWKSGRWTNPKHLGAEINQPDVWNYNPLVTPDEKYFIFGRRKMGEGSFSKLYWVSTEFIDSLRQTNFEPYVNREIENKVIKAGRFFSFQFPEDVFLDDDESDTLSYSAVLSDGTPLPSWLDFNPAKRTFSGIPTKKGDFSLKVRAMDPAKASIFSPIFTIKVLDE